MTDNAKSGKAAGKTVAPEGEEPTTEAVKADKEKAMITEEAESDTKDDSAAVEESEDEAPEKRGKIRRPARQFSVSLRGLLVGLLIVALAAGIGGMTWLYIDAERKLDAQERQVQNNARAETVALDYATNAAAMDSKDLGAWKLKLVAGTSDELKNRLSKAADQMEQILVPLQWNSTALPLSAKVRSENAGVYVVDAFVGVQTKTVQSPEPLQSTATYSVTIDSNKNWQITDVGGIGAALGGK